MKTSFPTGFEEPVIGFILKETLKALEYLHQQGHIHRDVKAGNILIDARGAVKVADFGVSACVFESGDRQRRNTFVGTPCWMAPEVIDYGGGKGYDHKADIWSFGITALELAHGHAPFSKFPPMKALLMQLQGAPPSLDYARDKKFSRAFREMVGLCLVKDPARRPAAHKLLKHSFFKHTKGPDYVVKHVLENLPGLAERVRMLRACETLKVEDDDEVLDMPHLRRISGWNFNEENLKFEPVFPDENQNRNQIVGDFEHKTAHAGNSNRKGIEEPANGGEHCLNQDADLISGDPIPSSLDPNPNLGSSPGSDIEMNSSSDSGSIAGEESKGLCDLSSFSESTQGMQGTQIQTSASSEVHLEEKVPQQSVPDLANKTGNGTELKGQNGQGFKPSIVQKKGRFSVTEEDVGSFSTKAVLHPLPPLRRMHSLSSQPSLSSAAASAGLQVSPKVASSPREVSSHSMPISALLPQMQTVLQSTLSQQDTVLHLLNNLGVGPDQMGLTTMNSISSHIRHRSVNERESELMQQISHLQDKFSALQEEVHAIKAKNAQLEHHLNTIHNTEEKEKLNKEEASILS